MLFLAGYLCVLLCGITFSLRVSEDIRQGTAYRTTLPIITNFIAKCNLILFYYHILTIYFNTIIQFYTNLYNLIEGVITNIDTCTLVYVQTKNDPLKMAI
jgi:hypothetical protein